MDADTKKQILKNIESGASINSQAKKYNMSWDTIKSLCDKNQIKSRYKHTKATEEAIINLIKEMKVASSKEIAESFGISTVNRQPLRRRLQSMVRRGKIKRTKLKTLKSKANKEYHMFEGYMENFLFYLTDTGFKEWTVQQIPKGLPSNIRKILSQYLHDMQIDIDLKYKKPMRTIAFTDDEYKLIKKKAKKQKKTIKECVLDAI